MQTTTPITLDDLAIRVRSTSYRQPRSRAATDSTSNNNNMMSSTYANYTHTRDADNDIIPIEPEVLLVHPPGGDSRSRPSDYVLRSHAEWEISNVPRYSETGTNPERHYELQVAGQLHTEGGWPRDCDPTDPEHRMRHLRRARKEAHFLASVKELAGRSIPVLRSNNAIDIYHSMFADLIDGKLGQGSHGLVVSSSSTAATGNIHQGSNSVVGPDGVVRDSGVAGMAAADDDGSYGNKHRRGGDADFDLGGADDEDEDDDLDLDENSPAQSRRAKLQRKRELEKEAAAKRAQLLSEEMQIAALAGRTVSLNATGVFRDAPRAFPTELLGTEVKDLVRAEQRKLVEQRIHDMDREHAKQQENQKPPLHQNQHHHHNTGDVFRKGVTYAPQVEQHQQQKRLAELSSQQGQSLESPFAAGGGGPTKNDSGSTNNTNAFLSPVSSRDSIINKATIMRQVVLNPCASLSSPKVVSSLSWVSNLEIPGCSPHGGATTLAIALASVANTPHLSLLGSTSAAELKAAIAQRRSSISGDYSSSTSPSASGMFFGGLGTNASEITMSGVDLFPTSLVYDAAAPQAPLLRLKTASDLVQLEFSPRDAPLLASGSSDGTLSLFDLRRGPQRCLMVADISNSSSSAAASSSSASHHLPAHVAAATSGSAAAAGLPRGVPGAGAVMASARRNPLNPVVSLRWIPSGTGARCTEFATADMSPFVRIWDTRFVTRGCLDVFNLSSGAVLAALHDAGLEIGGLYGSHGGDGNSNSNSAGVSREASGLMMDDSMNPSSHQHRATPYSLQSMHRAVSIDVQHISGRVYIGTTDGKVFVFNRKGRTDSDRLCGAFQIVPRECVYARADIYVHVAAHPTLPKCFAAATEWGVHVYADDLPRPVARLPPSPHGVPTALRWVPHCAALLCVSRMSGAVELWDVCVMLTSLADAGEPKAMTQVMEYSGSSSIFSNNSTHIGGGSANRARKASINDDDDESSSSARNPGIRVINSAAGPPISALRFSPDGSHLVAGLLDGSASLLDVTVQDDDALVEAAERAAAACGPKGVAPVTGARALELVCFGRVVEKRGALRTRRLLKLQQSAAPDATQASSIHYQEMSDQQRQRGAATMVKDKLGMDMARLSQQFTQAVASETSTTVVSPTSKTAHDSANSWVPPFRSSDQRASRVMERVGNMLFNPAAFSSPSPTALINQSSVFAGGLMSGGGMAGHVANTALASPLPTDETAVQQLSRAIETGVAVPPERSVAARRWSTVKRNLMPTRPKSADAAASSNESGGGGTGSKKSNKNNNNNRNAEGSASGRTSRSDFLRDPFAQHADTDPFDVDAAPPQSSKTARSGQGQQQPTPPVIPRRPRSVAVRIEHDDDDG